MQFEGPNTSGEGGIFVGGPLGRVSLYGDNQPLVNPVWLVRFAGLLYPSVSAVALRVAG
jgi:hypothetical protein